MRKYLLLAFFSLISLQIANAQCAILGATTVTVLSGSGNGTPGSPYSSGAVLRYCITIDEYFEDQTNWLHGVYLFPASLPAGATVDSSGNPGSTWIWYAGGCNGRPAGWYFDEDADNDPCNNFGDDPCGDDPAGPCGRTFCFKITIPLTGTGVAQQIQVKVTGDGTTGSWINSGCDDPPVNVGPPFSWGGAPSCPTLTVAPNVTITDNACLSGCSPIRTGTINTGSANCPSGSELRWFTNATTTTGGVTTTPTYAAATSYFARCVCTSDNTVLSPVTTITSAAACPADTTGPTISCPANATISGCFTSQAAALAAIPAANTNLVTATDPNGPINITHVGDALPINTIGCTYIVQRTYRATDICNNFSECNQIFTFFQGCTYVTTCSSVNNTRCVAPFNGSASVTTDASSPTYLWSNGATTSSISDLAAGTYTVSVTEALSGCTSTCSTTITDNIVTPTVTCQSTNNTNCSGAGNGTATATSTGVTYLWNDGSTNASISGLSGGAYTVTVTSTTTGCTATCSATINNPELPTVSCLSTNNTNCTGAGNGTATATSTGVTYLWSNGSTNPSLSGLSGGTYTVTVTSINSGCTTSCSTTLGDPTIPTVSCSSTNNTNCTGGGNGTATANSTGVTFLWSTGSTNAAIIGLSAGTYTVTVTRLGSGCTATCSAIVENPIVPAVTCSSTNNTACSGAGNGTASATSTGVTYSWSNGSTNPNLTGLSGGTYTVIVTSTTSGCTATCSATITNPAVPAVICSSTNNTNCTNPNGTASATATNASYLWSNGSTGASLSGLSAGTYTVIVTDLTTGCTASCTSVVGTSTVNPSVTCSATDNTSCTNPNGTASATATNVSYSWSNGSTSASISGLSAGTYTVIVTDLTTGCTASCTSVVGTNTINPSVTCSATDNTNCTTPNGTASATATNVSYSWSNGSTSASISGLSAGTYTVIVTDLTTGCTASCTSVVGTNTVNPSVTCTATDNTNCTTPNGTASATATNVSYSWSNGSTDASISGLSAGTYTVVATDLTTGCTASCTSVVGTNTVNPSVTCSVTDNTNCTTPNGTASATASNVSYSWSNGSTDASISGLSAGTYTVIVTDLTTGCTASCASVVGTNTVNPSVTCSATDNTSCTNPNGTSSATATNVSYSWSNGSTSASISGLSAGTYTVIVTDLTTGCTASCTSVVGTNTVNPSVTCSATDNTNCTNPNGTASATATNVSYSWSNGSTSASISGLSAGTYTVIVTDLTTGCTASCASVVGTNTVNPIVTCSATDNTNCLTPNGTASATATNVSYSWSNGSTSASISGLSAGTYTVIVTDLTTGCTASCTSVVGTNTVNPSVTCTATDNTNCTTPNGTASATATNVSYSWSNGSTSASISGLSAGTYTVIVTDLTTGCTASCASVVGTNTVNPNVTCSATDNTNCTTPNGTASATATNVTYTWSNGATTSSISGLNAGVYTVTVTDMTTGCTSSCTSNVASNTSNPTVTCSATDNSNCSGAGNGTASATASNVSYSWSNGSTDASISGLLAGTYTVVVTDLTTGCTASCESIVGSSPSSPSVTCSATDNTNCSGAGNGTAIATATNVSYSWSNGSTDASISGLSAGTYTVVVTDLTTGCTASCESIVGTNTTSPTVTCASTDNNSCTTPNGTASATATNVTYTWSNGATTSSISGLNAGVYTVTVTDMTTGCTSSCTSNVASNTSNPTVTCSATDNSNCSGAGNGTASATASNVSYSWSNGSTDASISGLSAGTYTVVVTDLTTGCTASCESIVGSSPSSPSVTCSATDNTNCSGAGNGTAIATATNVSYSWSNGSTDASISGLSAGTYTVVVTDLTTGCTASCESIVGTNTTNPAVTCASTDNNSCTTPNGTASATATNVTYTWSNGATTSSISGLNAGVYTVTVTDMTTGCTSSCTSNVASNTSNPTVTCSATDNSNCSGAGNGTASATASNVSYSWSNGSTDASISGLLAGTYTVVVTDLTTGCTASCESIVGSSPSSPSVTCSATDNTNCSPSNGAASATASNVSYSWSNGSTDASISGLSAGTYTVVVTDLTTGCTASCESIVGTNTTNPTVTCASTDNNSCTTPNGTASATATNVSYSWSNGSTDASISGLSAGTYTVVVTDLTTGCTASCQSVLVVNQSTPTVTCQVIQNNTHCFIFNGQCTVNNNLVSPTYIWSNGQTTQSLSGLAPGVYTVTVTEMLTGCSATCSLEILNTPAAIPTANCTATDNTGCTTQNGSASVTTNALNPTYIWSNGQTTASISGLAGGTYSVTVTDNTNGCTATCEAIVGTNSTGISATCSSTDVNSCIAPNGTANVITNSLNATFLWSNGNTTNAISGLSAGMYTVTVTDALSGCIGTCATTVNDAVIPVTATCGSTDRTNCSVPDGTVSVLTNAVSADFLWSNGDTNSSQNNLTAGTYTVVVTDINSGCSQTCSATVADDFAIISLSLVTIDSVSCFGFADGSIEVTGLTNGNSVGPYEYSLDNSSWQSSGLFTGLTAGVYTVYVNDLLEQCTYQEDYTIYEPDYLTISNELVNNINCWGENSGSVDITVVGGTLPYIFAWSDGTTNEDLVNVVADVYTVTITDANGCEFVSAFDVLEQPRYAIGLNNCCTSVSCHGATDGTAFVQVNGATPFYYGYNYLWNTVPAQTTALATNLPAGIWSLTITDSLGCDTTISILVKEPTLLVASTNVSAITCNGANNGIITLSVIGGEPFTVGDAYNIVWNTIPPQTGFQATGLGGGTYTATIIDSLNCIKNVIVTLTEPDPIFISMIGTDVSCFGASDGEVTADPVGGVGPYTYLWSDGQTTQTASNLSANTYTVTVTDFNGCTSSANILLSSPPQINAVYTVVNPTCPASTDGKILQTSISGGLAPFSYLWNSSPTQTTANLLNVAGGTYTVIVFDANGCSAQFTYSVLNPLPIACNATVVPITCSGNNNGSITLNTSGGTSPYTYLWSNGNTTSTNSGLALGTYTVTVTDVSGCTNSCSYTVSQLPGLSVNLSATNVTCNGSSNGTIISSIGGGLAPFGYLWSNGSTAINLTNIGPGIYTLTVTDNNGCSGTASVSITQPSALSCICNASVINVSCFGGNNGSVTALPIGGLAPYSYVWSNGQTTQTIISLTAGTYTVTITDANGCLKVGSVTITQPNQLFALMGCVQNVTCNGGSNGTACVNGFGGVAPYTYSWNTAPTITTSLATGLMAGTYTGIVTDANGCTASAQITISQPQLGVSCSITNTNITCFGNTNGSASAAVNGGTAPYTYLWSNGKTTQTVINLATGVYTVSVTDNVGCSSTCSVTITQPSAIAALYTVVRPLCNGNTNGSIDVSVVGGTSPYTYVWSNGATTQDLNNIGAGNYVLTIIDSKGCVLNASIAVTQPAVLNCSITKTNVTCNGGSNGSATVTATGGTSPYIYLWSNGVSTANNAGVAAGLYTVTITDSKGCTKNCFVTITQPSKLVCNANVLNIATCNNNNGKAQAVASGGVAPYTYIWLTAPVQTTAIATGLSSGTYVVVISDSKGCSSSCSVTVPSSNALSCSVFGINVSCNGGNDGTATVTVNGGVAPYTYLWNTSAAATTSSITSINAGTYTVIVTDANGCTTSCFIVITQPAPLTCVAISTSLSCDGLADGTATASVTGGTSPYAYLWSDGQTNITATGLSSGSYTVLITDSKGCTSQCATTIAVVSPLSCQTSVTNATCAGFPNGTATVTTAGGLAAFSYVWSTTPPQFGATATGLSAGLYTVTVTDANGCITTCDASITQPGNLSCIAANTMPVTCYAGNDGEAQVAVNGGTPGYTYLWNTTPLQTNSTATGLSGGTYIVIVTDNVGCTSSCDVLVVQPAVLACSISPINTTCGLNNGSATVNVTGGTSGYTYLWSNGQTNATISALATGNYTATVTDANGCTTSCNTGINASSTIILTINKTPTNCNSICTGTASVSGVAGGTSPYTYLWSNGVTSVSATGLCAGTYTVTVTDNIGCSGSFSFNINQLPSLIVNISNFSNVSCFGLADGSAQVVASGGSTPYLYLWSDGQTNALASNLSAGNYTVTVTDKKGCTGTAVVTITEPAQLIASETHIDVTCNGGSNGSVDVTLQGGSAPFSYSWSNGQTTQDINNVPANTYIVTITQSNGCSQTLSVQIAQPNALICGINSSSPSCNGNSNGTANVVVTGGTPGYTYLWSNGISGSTLSGLIAGTYTVTVNDANGCTTVCQTTITDPAVLMLTSGKADVKCKGGSDGVASVVASGGTSPYTYLWNNGQTTSSISGLAANSYTVTATDNNGCSASLVIIINEPSQLQLITTGSNPTCGNTNGSASASTAGGTPSYTYLWSNGQNGAIISSIGSGTYTVTVTDANGCTATSSVTIALSSNLNLNIVPTSPLCYGSAGSAIANVTGGSGIYSYIWNSVPVQTNLIATGLNAGSYTVIVSDNAGCTVSGSVTITEPQLLECTTTATGAACNGGCNGTATVAATGGTSPYVYNWNTIPTQTNATATGLCAGTYTVIVTDANGCTTSCVVSITGSPLLTCSVFKSNATKCGLPTGKLKAIPLGGSSPYTYLWNTGTTTQVLNFLFGGTYTVTVTDKFGCTSSCEATLKAHGPVDCFVTSTDASCGACNGTASVLASGGGLAYTYKWSTGATTKAISGLCPNTYVVTVSDQYACTKTCVVIIVTNNNLSCSVTGVNVQCNGGSNATATVSAVGGTGIYTYLWTTGATTQTVTGLTAGTYTATVTSGNNCTSTCSIVITKPQPLICTITATDASCGVCNGTGIINVVGGTAPYTYLWSNGLTNNVATTLCAGSYSALITDANGCSSACSVVINSIGNISCTISGTNVTCNGLNNGTATVNASGATATSYLWSNGQTNQTATGLVAGAYTATVSAGPGCTSSCVVIITEPAAITCTTTSTLASCGVCNGSASVTAISGNPPFSYLWNNGSTTTSLSGLCGGLYTITVTDATGCTSICNVSVGTSNPLSCIISRTNVSCNGGTNGSATVNPTGGAGYTYLWSNGSTTKTITGLGAGSYTVTVSANNGCTTSCNVTITQPAILSCATTSTPAKCAVCNGTATITATGGTIPYTYLWSTGSTTKTILALCSGVYTVSVTDKKGCTTTCTVSVGATTPISCSMTKKDISCNGGNDGTATVTAFGGTSYTYLWNNGQTTATATGLTLGNYDVTVTEANGCTSVCTINITEPAALTCSALTTNASCGQCIGTATVSSLGGTAPYTYLWYNGSTATTISGLCAGSYSVTVTDSKGCTSNCVAVVSGAGTMSCTTTKTNITCNNGSNGTATVIPTGGANYTYLWSNAATTSTITGLSSGTYTVTVTAGICTTSCKVVLSNPNLLTCSIFATNVACGCTGSATITPVGGVAPYTYLWNNGQTTKTRNGLCAGVYTATTTDSRGCTTTCEATISGGTGLSCSINGTNVSCNGGSNGIATVTAIGGSGYTYLWTNGSTNQTNTGLIAGTYTVTVTSSGGCTTTCSLTITQPTALSCNATSTNASCGVCNATANVTSNGGTLPYSYLWSNGATLTSLTALCSGTYTVTTTDGKGCTATCTTIVTAVGAISCTITGTNVSCNGGTNGSGTVNATGGSGYTYLWNNGATTQTRTGLAAGTYTATVTSANGCTTTCSVTITQPTALTCSVASTTAACGVCNGTATVTATGGTPTYTYLWSNAATTASISGLCGGTYTVTTTDSKGCTSTCTTLVGSTGSIACTIAGTNVSCNGGTNGSGTVNATGGSGYTYLWNNGVTTQTRTGLAAGTYTATVTSANGCTTTCSVTITQPTALTCSVASTAATCGVCNGTATVTATGGTPTYTYLWSNAATTASISGLCGGTYTVTATDSRGCTTTCTTLVGSTGSIACTIAGTNVSCNGGTNGSGTVNATGGSGYTYLWNNGVTTQTRTGLAAGTYTATVTSANGCTTTCSVTITQPAALTCSVASTTATCGVCNGTATVTAAGGTPTYTYLWSNAATTSSISGLCGGTYTVTTTDSKGCTSTCTTLVGSTGSIACTITGTNVSCNGGSNGSGTVNATGGSGYTYLWNNGVTTQTRTGLAAGTYTATVTSANGCTTTCSVTITQPAALTCSVSSTAAACGVCNGTATVTATGGTPTYTYLWSNAATTASISGLCGGTYTVTTTDSRGCTTTCTTLIGSTGSIACTIAGTNVSCNGGTNGSGTVNATGGSGYTYLWNNGVTTQTRTGLAAGTYTATVTSANGCTTTCSVTITQPAALTTSTSTTPASCGICNGTATATPAGGTAPYTYSWNSIPVKTTATASGLCSGTFVVTVTDSKGCTRTAQAIVGSASSTVTCSITTNNNVSCFGANNGSLTAVAGGGTSPYTYLWSNGKTTAINSGVTVGTYTVTITDVNGCTSSCTKVVTQPTQIVVVMSGKDASSCNNNDGTATASVSGGTPGYTYVWSNGGTNSTIIGLVAGTYTVTVTDSKGCTKTGSIVILQPAYVCTTFYTGHAQTYWNSNWKPDTLYKYLDANFNTVFPAGLKLQGTCGTAKSLLLTSAAAARITMQGTVNVAALTQSYVDPTLLALNNSLAAQLVTLALNIQFDLANPNFAPSTVNFKDLVVDSGPLTGLTVQQVFNEGVNALTGCGSVYSNSILRTYAAFINSSWYIGNKTNNVLTCPVNNCSKSSTWFSTDDELSFNAYPNPVLDELAISFISSKDTKFDVVIFDMTGRVVYRQESLATEGANTFRYNTSSFAQGIYTVQLRIDGLTRTVKIVKQ